MKKVLFTIAIAISVALSATAQEHKGPDHKPRFSPEEFQAKQRAYITGQAELTPEEADKFFPLFFELQKKKFEIEHNARKDAKPPRGERPTEQQCREFAYRMADAKIETAKLEREYIDKYLQVLDACKLQRVLRAEDSFQRDLMKRMMQCGNERRMPHDFPKPSR